MNFDTTGQPGRRALLAAAGALMAAAPARAAAGITLLSGFRPGGLTDIAAQAIAPGFGRGMGGTATVAHRPGSNGDAALLAALGQRGDGRNFLLAHNAQMVVQAYGQPNRTIDTQPLMPVGAVAEAPLLLVAHRDVPAGNATELAAWLRRQPLPLLYAASSPGGLGHCAFQLWLRHTGHVAAPREIHMRTYNDGAGPALAELLRGEAKLGFFSAPAVLPAIASGQAHAVLATGGQRLAALPDVATAAEQGLPELTPVTAWTALFAMPRTPAAAIARANAALVATLAEPGLRQSLAARGATVLGGSAAALKQRLGAEEARWVALSEAQEFDVDG
ncbi:tripartite tricarboxylate transporter substrate binding protein [Roseomonas sp. 18066]|uniref:tripartite tricarboxylate transporter substrate binding protein n=1 Tax=Roseomonas sp. 18066 TaxID=2681412 RepID=UPI00135776D9|nr:tripartite tricarboxylate transporter substrate binding protein [Roseomonas sp. 18066]